MLASVWQNLGCEVSDLRTAGRLADAWHGLATSALEPTPFNIAEMSQPIIQANKDARLLTVSAPDELLLTLPFQQAVGYRASLASDFTASSLPLVHRAFAAEAVQALLNHQHEPFLFRALPLDSVFAELLRSHAGHCVTLKSWVRAGLKIEGTYDAWLAANFDHKRRKELKRLRSRLGEQGRLATENLNQTSELEPFIQALLQLEAKGWKGKRGTALKAEEATETTFRAICAKLHASGRLRFWILRFNDQPIAALFGVVHAGQAAIIKIAHDEAFSKYSPGVLLVLDATESLFGEGGVVLADSCAIPGHPMIERIWRDRLAFGDVLVAPPSISTLRFQATAVALQGHAALRKAAKTVFYKLSKRKMS